MNMAPWDVSKRDIAVVVDGLVYVTPAKFLLWDWTDFGNFIDMDRWRDVADVIAEHHKIDPDRLITAIAIAETLQAHPLLNQWQYGTSRRYRRAAPDDISNLQFLCRGHNAAKGDRQQ